MLLYVLAVIFFILVATDFGGPRWSDDRMQAFGTFTSTYVFFEPEDPSMFLYNQCRRPTAEYFSNDPIGTICGEGGERCAQGLVLMETQESAPRNGKVAFKKPLPRRLSIVSCS